MIYDWLEEEKITVFGIRHLVPDNMSCKFVYPCRLVIVNDYDFGEILEKASNNLKKDGLKFFCETTSGDADGKCTFHCQTKHHQKKRNNGDN